MWLLISHFELSLSFLWRPYIQCCHLACFCRTGGPEVPSAHYLPSVPASNTPHTVMLVHSTSNQRGSSPIMKTLKTQLQEKILWGKTSINNVVGKTRRPHIPANLQHLCLPLFIWLTQYLAKEFKNVVYLCIIELSSAPCLKWQYDDCGGAAGK